METVSVRYRDWFRIEEDIKLYPLTSNITDRLGVIIEHRRLNGNNKYLRYGIQQIKGKYYFFDVRNTAMENTKEKDLGTFICPYCGEDMFIVSSFVRGKSTIPIHLKHYRKTNKGCIFRTDTESMKARDAYYNSEEYLSREMIDSIYKKVSKGVVINLPVSYTLLNNIKTRGVRATIKDEPVKIINVKRGDEVLKSTSKYIPHLIFYTEDNREIYCEVTVRNSKTISQYYDIWKENKKTVLEIKKIDDVLLYPSKYIFDQDLTLAYLYDPVLDEIRKRKIYKAKQLADSQVTNKSNSSLENKKLSSLEKTERKLRKNMLKKELGRIIDESIKTRCSKNLIRIGEDNKLYYARNNTKIEYNQIEVTRDGIMTSRSVPKFVIDELRSRGYSIKVK